MSHHVFTDITSDTVTIVSYAIDDRKRFCEEMLQKIDSGEAFLDSASFSDEAELHLHGIVNRSNCRMR
jgi:hypothetical protein